MKTFSDIQALMRSDLQKTDAVLNECLSSDVALINQMSRYIVAAGGKRLRPLLVLLCAKATGYKGSHHHLMAVVIELIHTATLLHDDIVDESNTRRGVDTANQVWGNAPSVLVGDFLYSRAFEMMIKPDSMTIMKILSKTTNNIAEGEVLQLLNCKNPNISQQDYFEVIKRKTARLFQAATQIGAVLSQSNKQEEESLSNYGLNLGNAFQIIDDLLDYQSGTELMGKETGDDLAEGKITLPMIYALENTSGKKHQLLKNAIENADKSKISEIIDILTTTKAFDFATKEAKKFALLAKQSIKILQPSPYKDALVLLCETLVNRQS